MSAIHTFQMWQWSGLHGFPDKLNCAYEGQYGDLAAKD